MRSSTRRFNRLVLVSLLAFAAPAISMPAVAIAKPSRKKQAAALSRRAIKLYKRGEYQRAAALFLEAFELSGRSAQLRNAAKAYEEANLLDDAKPLWERYLRQDDITQDERNEARAHIQLIAEREKNEEFRESAADARAAAENARLQAERARRAAEAASSASGSRSSGGLETTVGEPGPPVGGYIVLGGGIAALAAGSILWFVSSSQLADVDDRLAMRDGTGKISGITPTELENEVSSINTKRVFSGVLVTAGVVAAAGGVAWMLLANEEGGPDTSVSFSPMRGGAQLGIVGRF